jgi:hypothetical protein
MHTEFNVLGRVEMEADIGQMMRRGIVLHVFFSIPWVAGPAIYGIGLLVSIYTGNLGRFISDYPWACLCLVVTIGIWVSPRLIMRHGKFTMAIRRAFKISDEDFTALLEGNIRRLVGRRNLVFGLTFLPALLWAWTQRLWWQEYSQPFFFDAYCLLILILVLFYYSTFMFAGAVSCNLNVYRLCEKTPVDYEYILSEGQPVLRRLWGGQLMRVTAVALILSALTNVPILLYSGSASLLLNLTIALALTTLIFVVPHYMFHRLLERAKENMLAKVLDARRKMGFVGVDQVGRGDESGNAIGNMLGSIYLTQYEGVLSSKTTWLINLEVVAELLIVGSLHVTFMEILNMFAHR